MILIGVLFLLGSNGGKNWNRSILLAPPLLATLIFGFEPALRVSKRVNDGFKGATEVKGNNVNLIWAPAGPGWPQTSSDLNYTSWNDVNKICAHLSEDGLKLEDTVVGVWRLPSIEEVVASLTRNGNNAGGEWNKITKETNYKIKPDKESPLWNSYSPIIYWWTSTEVDSNSVYRIVYNGTFQKINKKLKMGSLGFRAVKDVQNNKNSK
ncbi:MAG: hypothetical protein J0L69_15540 [Bacteroidetes bacterium]|nr:hypothetical protein [Bacteroidota bacterium]